MKQKSTWIIMLIVFVSVLLAASLLYRGLSEGGTAGAGQYTPPTQSASAAPQKAPPVKGASADKAAPEQEEGEAPAEETPGESEDKVIPAPDFTVYDREGGEVSLSDFVGKPVVVNFWASWCPPCKEELPHFDKLAAEYGEDVAFMMVDLTDGSRETVEIGTKYIDGLGFTFPLYFDTDQDAAMTYGISSIPVTLFVDAEGNVSTGYIGMMNEETIRRCVEDMLAGE